jgi:hypothetical protein
MKFIEWRVDNRGIEPESKAIDSVDRGLAPMPQGGYIRGNQFSEFPFQEPKKSEKPQDKSRVSIAFERRDLSKGTARFGNTVPINKNLALKKAIKPGAPESLMVHGNIEVHFYNVQGYEVPMTERWVRYWKLEPKKGTTVANQGSWTAYTPNESPFAYDYPSAEDVPGWQAIYADDGPAGQIQEFLAGSDNDGGVYFNTWTLQDVDATTRVIHFNMRKLNAKEYREALVNILKKDYVKTHKDRLLFNMPIIPSRAEADTGVMILPKRKSAAPQNSQKPASR